MWSIFALQALLAFTYLATKLGPLLQRDALPALAEIWTPGSRKRIAERLSVVPAPLLGALPLALLAALTIRTNGVTEWTLFWAALIVIICSALLLVDITRSSVAPERSGMMATLLIGCAAGLLMICEVVYLRDVFGGALFRMNSVFKFYYQAWLLLGIASGPLLVWLGNGALGALRSVSPRINSAISVSKPAIARPLTCWLSLTACRKAPDKQQGMEHGADARRPTDVDTRCLWHERHRYGAWG